MIVAFSMYEIEETRDVHDRLWGRVSRRLQILGIPGVPTVLTRGVDDHEIWSSPDLLLGQICGLPLVTRYSDELHIVGTPVYEADGCDGIYYRSRIVVEASSTYENIEDLRGATLAINDIDSQSGSNVPRAMVAPFARGGRFFGNVITTGSHRASMAAVCEGRADFAAIDCVLFATLQRFHPEETERLRTLTLSPEAPGLAMVTSQPDMVAPLRRVLSDIFTETHLHTELMITGLQPTTLATYRAISTMRRIAETVPIT